MNFDCNKHSGEYHMECNGLNVGFNMVEALSGDAVFSLPPYGPRPGYLVDEYPACPDNWLRSFGKLNSYFVPIQMNKGMWLDFNGNWRHNHEVAIVVSIQGINALTGLPTSNESLEQYHDRCPKCDEIFGPNRLCKSCNITWPKQNYIATTTTEAGRLWIDGFRTIDGMVRQYIFNEKTSRGVANNILGEERVFAIGIAFFLSKNPKPVRTPMVKTRSIGPVFEKLGNKSASDYGFVECRYVSPSAPSFSVNQSECTLSTFSESNTPRSIETVNPIKSKNVDIAAGAKIEQKFRDDPNSLEFWNSEPEGIICINYCLEEEVEKIIAQGKINMKGHEDGFLQKIPVGN